MVRRRSYVPPLLNYTEPETHLGWLQDKLDSKVKAPVKEFVVEGAREVKAMTADTGDHD